ncbi:MAG: DsrE/DsrF/DrsH-like family protein [Actinomycetota bacterium]|jgi:peroxiredoxin family protein|nr:DsrE/DsrF/DrsH-like family protein [Actinomycetota bacterium]
MTTTEIAPAIVPDFGDEDEGRKIAFVCSKGTLDMAYPALIMASGALEQGIETHIFFTFWGMDMINKKTMGDLKFTPVGNTATHMPMALTPFPGMTTMATRNLRKSMAALNIPDVPTFLSHLSDMGCHLWACKMSVDMFDLKEEDMTDDLDGVLNVSDFIEIIAGAQTMFI